MKGNVNSLEFESTSENISGSRANSEIQFSRSESFASKANSDIQANRSDSRIQANRSDSRVQAFRFDSAVKLNPKEIAKKIISLIRFQHHLSEPGLLFGLVEVMAETLQSVELCMYFC